jgi:hypothetical protein
MEIFGGGRGGAITVVEVSDQSKPNSMYQHHHCSGMAQKINAQETLSPSSLHFLHNHKSQS